MPGDCQCGSPGFSAAFGTYTMVDHATGRILAQVCMISKTVVISTQRLSVYVKEAIYNGEGR